MARTEVQSWRKASTNRVYLGKFRFWVNQTRLVLIYLLQFNGKNY